MTTQVTHNVRVTGSSRQPRKPRRRGGRPRLWLRCGCLGCSIPLLAAIAAAAAAVLLLT